MRCLQVRDGDGSLRTGLLEGARVRLLSRPHAGIATTLDLLLAMEAGRLEAAAWRADAESAGAFDDVA